MNVKALAILGTSTMTSLLLSSAAGAVDYPKQAYQAEYELTSASSGKSVHRIASDGKGRGYSEMISDKSHSKSIIDWQAHKILILMPEKKMVMSMNLRDDDVSMMMNSAEKIASKKQSLGTKIIDGHLCTGTMYDLNKGGNEEVWNGNDIGGMRVYSKTTLPQIGTTEARLKKFSSAPPSSEMLTVPVGYQSVSTGQ